MKRNDQRPGQEPPPPLTDETRKELIDRLYDGETLISICADPRMPTRGTLRRLLSDKSDAELWVAAYRAQQNRCCEWADETIDIADRTGRDLAGADFVRDIGDVRRRDQTGRDRLRIEARQWLLRRLQPDKYKLSKRRRGSQPEPLPTLVAKDFSNLPEEEVIPKTDPSEKFRSRSDRQARNRRVTDCD